MKNKGDVVSFNLIMTILAILGLAVLLLFLFRIYGTGNNLAETEACHLSVIKRATLDTGVGNFQQTIPLDCVTQRICITTEGKDSCEGFFAGSKSTKTIKVSNSDEEEARRIIEETSANAMYDCWRMMGEGKLDIFGKFVEKFSITEPKCVICSRVFVADDVDFAIRERVNTNEYMRTQQIPGSSLTYLQALTDRSVSSYSQINDWDGNYSSFPDDFSQMAFVFMQIKTRDPLDSAFDVVKGSFAIGGAGLLTSTGRFAAKTAGLPGMIAFVLGVAVVSGAEYYQAQQSQQIAAGYCGEFESSSDAKQGCSLVRGVEWDTSAINSFCKGGIEGRI